MAVGPDPQPRLSLPTTTHSAMPSDTYHTSLNVTKEISLISKGSFVVLKPIGRGSMGIVFLIKSIEDNRKEGNELFAMKEMDYKDTEVDDKFKLIQREIRILSHLSHPHIVHYYTSMVSVRNSCIQLIQEFCNRGTLYQVVKERRSRGEDYFTENEVIIWSNQLSNALVYLHASKVLHRDLKSQNIFLTSSHLAESTTTPHNTIIKLGDFGISRPLETTCDLVSTCVGTPAYMAPEVCHRSLYSYPCDMWSLGCVLVEMCSLKPAFQSASLVSMVFKILNADYTQIPGMYSKALNDLIDSLFSVDPELRPTAKQVVSVFTDWMKASAEYHTLDEYDNDFDSLSDNSAAPNLEDSQRMATLSLSQDTLIQPTNEIVVVNREISRQNSECYSDDFDSFSENEDG